jgi:integrase
LGAEKRPTVTELMESFFAAMRAGSALNRRKVPYKESAAVDYEESYARWLKAEVGSKRLDEVTNQLLQAIADDLLGRGLSRSSVRNAITPVRAGFRWYRQRNRDFDHDPFHGLDLPKETEFKFRAMPIERVKQFLEAMPRRDRLAWGLAFLAGLRIGEIQALRWADVDLEGRCRWIQYSWSRKLLKFLPVKTDSSNRMAPIQELLLPMFEWQRAENVRRFGEAGVASDSLVIPGTSVTRPFQYRSFCDRGRKAAEEAGLVALTPHKGRHNFVSIALEALAPQVVSEMVGHAHEGFTLHRYAHRIAGSHSIHVARLDSVVRTLEQQPMGVDPERGDSSPPKDTT